MRVYLDTNFFVAAIEGFGQMRALCGRLLECGQARPGLLVTSEITLAELLAGPVERRQEGGESGLSYDDGVKLEPDSAASVYGNLIATGPALEVRPVTRDVLILAAYWRAEIAKIKLPDAIHLATAAQANCGHVLSGDRRLRPSAIHDFERVDVTGPDIEALLAKVA